MDRRRLLVRGSSGLIAGALAQSRFFGVANAQTTTVASSRDVPNWARGAALWQDFAANIGNLPEPADLHPEVILASDAAGVFVPFAAQKEVRTNLGLQSVPTRTNAISNNSLAGSGPDAWPVGWDIHLPEGVAARVVATGTVKGLPYFDVAVSGSPTVDSIIYLDLAGPQTIAARASERWACAAFLQVLTGSVLRAGFGIQQQAADGSPLPHDLTDVRSATSTLDEHQSVFELTDSSTAYIVPYLWFETADRRTANFTLRLTAPQVEKAPYIAAPILTRNGPVTVAGNPQSIDLGDSVRSGSVIATQSLVLGMSDGDWVWQDSDSTPKNRAGIRRDADRFKFVIDSDGADSVSIDMGAFRLGSVTFVAAYGHRFSMAQMVGEKPPTSQSHRALPKITTMTLGGAGDLTGTSYLFTQKVARSFGVQGPNSFAAWLERANLAATSLT